MVTYLLLGCLFGAMAGFVPGVGNTIIMAIMFPFLISVEPINVIVFYVSVMSISQYTGSVSGTVFSVPGEMSSLPAVKEGHRLYRRGLGALSLSGCAIGSMVGSILAVGFVLWVGTYLHNFTFLYSTKFMSAVLIIVLLFLIFGRHNKWYVNILLCAFGYFLAAIGTGSLYRHQTLSFGIDDLIRGIPLFCVVAWLYVFPEVLKNWETKISTSEIQENKNISLTKHLSYFVNHYTSVIRGSFFGFFLGLTPYLTTIIASNVSYNFESWLRKKQNKYNDGGDYGSLIASETANNSAALSSLLPLLLLGIPITSSEAILLEIISINGFDFNIDNFFDLFVTISYCLVAINLIGLCIAWPLARYFNVFYLIDIKTIYTVVLFFCVIATVYIGAQENAMMYYICIGSVFSAIGFLLRKVDTMPIIFIFMMQDGIETNLTRLMFHLI